MIIGSSPGESLQKIALISLYPLKLLAKQRLIWSTILILATRQGHFDLPLPLPANNLKYKRLGSVGLGYNLPQCITCCESVGTWPHRECTEATIFANYDTTTASPYSSSSLSLSLLFDGVLSNCSCYHVPLLPPLGFL